MMSWDNLRQVGDKSGFNKINFSVSKDGRHRSFKCVKMSLSQSIP